MLPVRGLQKKSNVQRKTIGTCALTVFTQRNGLLECLVKYDLPANYKYALHLDCVRALMYICI